MNTLSKKFWKSRSVRVGATAVLVAAGGITVSAQSAADKAYCDGLQEGSAKIACLRDLKASAAAPAAPVPAKTPDAAAKSTPAAAAGNKMAAGTTANGAAPYKVVDGNKVDPATLEGFHTWRQAACDRCHGANQEGMVGPSLINSLKVLSKEEFVTTITNGRPEKGMPSWSSNPNVMKNMDNLYAYLKGRSDGAITKAKVEPM